MSTIVGTNGAAGKRKASTAFVPDSISSYLMGCLRTNFEHLQHHIHKDCAFAAAKTEAPAYIKQLLEELFRYLYLLGGDSSDGVIRSSPSYFVDQAFHCLMLDPVLYLRVCDEILTMHGKDTTEVAVRVLPHDALGGQGEDEAPRKARYMNTLTRYKETFGQDAPLALWTDYSDDRVAVRAEYDAQRAEAAFKIRPHHSAAHMPRPTVALPVNSAATPASATSAAVAPAPPGLAVALAAPVVRNVPAPVVAATAVLPTPGPVPPVPAVKPKALPAVSQPRASSDFIVRIVGADTAPFDMRVTPDTRFVTVCDDFAFQQEWDPMTVTFKYKSITPGWNDTLRMHNVKDGDEIHYVILPPVTVKVCHAHLDNFNDPESLAREAHAFECYQEDLIGDAFVLFGEKARYPLSEYQFSLNGQFVPHNVTVGSLNLGDNDIILGCRRVSLVIIDTAGKKTHVRLKCTSRMTYALMPFAFENGYRSVTDLTRHKFMYQGVQIKNSDTPNSLKMTHRSKLYVFKPYETVA